MVLSVVQGMTTKPKIFLFDDRLGGSGPLFTEELLAKHGREKEGNFITPRLDQEKWTRGAKARFHGKF